MFVYTQDDIYPFSGIIKCVWNILLGTRYKVLVGAKYNLGVEKY
jgi:hypothetical protein